MLTFLCLLLWRPSASLFFTIFFFVSNALLFCIQKQVHYNHQLNNNVFSKKKKKHNAYNTYIHVRRSCIPWKRAELEEWPLRFLSFSCHCLKKKMDIWKDTLLGKIGTVNVIYVYQGWKIGRKIGKWKMTVWLKLWKGGD